MKGLPGGIKNSGGQAKIFAAGLHFHISWRTFTMGGSMVRRMAAVTAGKTARILSHIGGFGGSSLPGRVALQLDPGLVRHLASQISRQVLMITGTNGKTTTSNMVSHILRESGRRVVSNAEGANMPGGVATAFLAQSSLAGTITCDHAVIETDEGHFPAILSDTGASVVAVTNFFRDQLDRYGEIDTTVAAIARAVDKHRPHLVLNADDPLVYSLSRVGVSVTTYGLQSSDPDRRASHAREGRFCPACQTTLSYTLYHYGQLGHYSCPNCAFKRPAPDVVGYDVSDQGSNISCTVRFPDSEHRVVLPTRGLYNLHNALAAAAISVYLGIPPASVVSALRTFRHATGRLQEFKHRGRPVYLNLVKNPAGFNEALGLVVAEKGTVDVLLALNDNTADGRDVSWIFDAESEMLRTIGERMRMTVCTGLRAEEMAIRLRYAGLDMSRVSVEPKLKDSISRILGGDAGTIYILATYTALWPLEKTLRKRLGGA